MFKMVYGIIIAGFILLAVKVGRHVVSKKNKKESVINDQTKDADIDCGDSGLLMKWREPERLSEVKAQEEVFRRKKEFEDRFDATVGRVQHTLRNSMLIMNKTIEETFMIVDHKDNAPTFIVDEHEFKLAINYFLLMVYISSIETSINFSWSKMLYEVECLFLHEKAHADVAKSFGRFNKFGLTFNEIQRRGFSMYQASQSYFVSTTIKYGSKLLELSDKEFYEECIIGYSIVNAPAIYCQGEAAILSNTDIEMKLVFGDQFSKRFEVSIAKCLRTSYEDFMEAHN